MNAQATDRANLQKFLGPFLPKAALSYVVEQICNHPVGITVSRSRKSKWGDYRIRPDRPPQITVNGDLPEAFFLLTLLHELAHHHVHLNHGLRRVAPHGTEWKTTFSSLMAPLVERDDVFDPGMRLVLRRHLRSPKANASSDQHLYREYLRLTKDSATLLHSLPSGSSFLFRNRRFTIKHRVRKRIACECHASQRTYLFQPLTPVALIDS